MSHHTNRTEQMSAGKLLESKNLHEDLEQKLEANFLMKHLPP